MEDLSPNSQAWWSRKRCEYLLNQMSRRHRVIADAMIAGSEISYGTVFRRVRNGKSMAEYVYGRHSRVLTNAEGGSGRQILFAAGKGQFSVRLLTGRECARLMGAGEFLLNVPLNQALFGFGDAVCVPVIEWIANNYLNPVWRENFAVRPVAQSKAKPIKYGKGNGQSLRRT